MLDSSYFCGKSSFEDSGTEIYLLFQPMCRYFKKVGDTDHTSAWKSKGLSNEVLNLSLHLIIALLQ